MMSHGEDGRRPEDGRDGAEVIEEDVFAKQERAFTEADGATPAVG